jgi:hypothetical protein
VPAGSQAGPRPLQRLTRTAYENTVRDLLQLDQLADSALPEDARGSSGFVEAGAVGEVDAARLQEAAEKLARLAVDRGLTTLLGCTPERAQELGCVERFVRSFGRRAFRRPLTELEVADLMALFSQARGTHQLELDDAVALLLEAVLQAPQFLYLRERATPDDAPAGSVIALTPDELASRLSYLFWRSMPDSQLFAAADGGSLSTPADAAREARRLFDDSRSRDTIVSFVADWFELPLRSETELSAAASAETAAFVRKVLSGDGKLETLLTAPVHIVNATLAPIYGVEGAMGSELREVQADPTRRFGLLTQVNFLGSHADGAQSHPVKRGRVIYQQVLCGVLPPMPDDVPQPEAQREGVSNRERFALHSQNACAVGCHQLIDPLGFAFEHYDGTGRYRDMDAGKPIDAAATFPVAEGMWSFQNARELVSLIATSEQARSCATAQWSRFALGRAELPEDQNTLTQAGAAFAASGYDLRELFVAIVQTPSFLYRTSTPPEGGTP